MRRIISALALGLLMPMGIAHAQTPPNTVGRILLQVEDKGQAWYVLPTTQERLFLPDGTAAYGIMRTLGLGITSKNLSQIPIGVDARFVDTDTDGDGLPDALEAAIGTSSTAIDSDHDGFTDAIEIKGGFDPLGPGKISVNSTLVQSTKGKILLQVESKGEAWYVNPVDGKRYYLKDGNAAYTIMRLFGLGATTNTILSIKPSSTQVECGTSLDCFIRAVENTQPSKVLWRHELDLGPLLGITLIETEELTTTVSDSVYKFLQTFVNQEVTLSPEQRKVLFTGGETEEEIDASIAELQVSINAGLEEQGLIQTVCTYQNPVGLATVLRRWQQGDIRGGINRTTTEAGTIRQDLLGDYIEIGQCFQ